MRISQLLELGVTQKQLEFIDINLEKDYALFIDPFLISKEENAWSISVNETIKNFFNHVVLLIKEEKTEEAIKLFQFMSEPKETCLGLSKSGTTNGKGIGEYDTKEIINEIIKSEVVEKELVKNIEDIIVFVEDVGKDKLSDMVTNLIRGHLLDYTEKQCKIWDISTTKQESLPFWNKEINDWDIKEKEHLIINGRNILLVPKFIVSLIDIYSPQKYDWHYAVEKERSEHLERKSTLVKYKEYKNGKIKVSCTKKDVSQYIQDEVRVGKYKSRKDFLREFTLKNKGIYELFIKECGNQIQEMKNDDLEEYVEKIDTSKLIEFLTEKLRNIPTGNKAANDYHLFIKSILELIFYPSLVNPTIEEKIHDGRKRIDIVMENNSKDGFFNELHRHNRIFCPYIFIECKNYGKEISNPELDQLSGRFSTYRGEFGILMFRNIENNERLIKRCQDTYKDGRGLIIPLMDSDIVSMLQSINDDKINYVEDVLKDLKKKIILS